MKLKIIEHENFANEIQWSGDDKTLEEKIRLLLLAQAELTRSETIKECIEAIRLPDELHWHGELCDEYHCAEGCRFIQADRCVFKLSTLLTPNHNKL